MPRFRVRFAPLALALVCGLAAGCGSGNMKTAKVKGVITYKSKPVPSGTITFVPEGNAPSATGQIKPDGSFELTTYTSGDGAVLGKHTVMIVAVQDQGDRLPEDRSPILPPIIPGKYMSNTTSGLTAQVKDEDNVINFELTGELK
jgi:hypothetical protein